jgi:1,4-dihydroxy-6-naphthoate synthase
MTRALRLGLSTCPNDTFLFHALLEGLVRPRGFELEFVLGDIEELNERMLRGELDASKTSIPAMLALAERAWVLPVGMAVGFGVGPLLLAAPGRASTFPLAAGARVLAPGRSTTAALLVTLLNEHPLGIEHDVFARILPRLAAGEADYGVCIHEARFTWREYGLALVRDLGAEFEARTGSALPLGGIAAARALGPECAAELTRVLGASLDWARAHRAETLPTMRRHAQELDERVLWAHVDLYVNDWTRDLGSVGRQALSELARLARAKGLLAHSRELEVLG